MTPQEFVRRWKTVELSERSAAQSHFIDLCRLMEHPTPAEEDPSGDHFTFEKGLTKTGGGDGFADVWKKGFFAWEYKKKGKNLDAALEQLSRYAAALENPPLHVASDMDKIVVVTAWTNSVPETHKILLEEIAEPGNWEKLRAVFHDPERLKPQLTRQTVTADAAMKFVAIADRLQNREPDSEAVAHFVNQLVFCFFAEDVKLLPEGFFTRVLKRAAQHPERCQEYLDKLFAAMEEGGEFDLTDIRHFNGGLFDGRRSLKLQADEIGLLIDAANLEWDQIDPTIFGTLFERFLDPDKRAQIGAHYTDTDKIMMIVEPVVLRPLRKEWEEAKAEIARIVSRTVGLGRQAYQNAMRKAEERRAQFLERLRTLSILDPACGSGNFLYLALQGVKDIEHRANLECEALGLSPQAPMVGPEILRGIEINRPAAELARTTIWIGHIQWAIRNGFHSWPSPILKRLDTIECRDALVEQEESTGEWREAMWPKAEFIVGNPPFLGSKWMLDGLGESYTLALRRLFVGRVESRCDLVMYWFDKARAALVASETRVAGLVGTNMIRGPANRIPMERIASDCGIFNAWSDEPWIVAGADVRVSLVCFGISNQRTELDGLPVDRIFPDLSGGAIDLTAAKRLGQNIGVAVRGIERGGAFDIKGDLARAWLIRPANPNGRSNSDVLRPMISWSDIAGRPSDRWIIDFTGMNELEAALYEGVFEHAALVLRESRSGNRERRTAARWWLFRRSGEQVREAIRVSARYIATGLVSRHRVFAWVPSNTLPDTRLVVIARDDDVTFGILCSASHEAWTLRLCQYHGVGNDPVYTHGTTFETFPFPEGLTPDIPAKDYANDTRAVRIAAAAKRLDELRNAWLNPPDLVEIVPEVMPGYPDRILPKTVEAQKLLRERTLTRLYNARPQWLADAHAELDRAVAAAYGWPDDIATDDALGRLLDLNVARSQAG